MCDPLSRLLSTEELLLLGPIPLHELRPTDLPRKPPRHRSLSAFDEPKTLPHGPSRASSTIDIGRCQRGARLADLRRFRTGPNRHRAAVVLTRSDWCGPGSKLVCAGFDDHRSVPLAVSVGQVPQDQRRGEDAYAARSAWQYPHIH